MLVTGFHGTTLSRANNILTTGFTPSTNDGDWLGYGAYFFQDAPARARHWAQLQCTSADDVPAVISAQINLHRCLDLQDLSDFIRLRDIFRAAPRGLVFPTQEPLSVKNGRCRPPQPGFPLKGLNKWDRFLLDYAVAVLDDERPVTTVRASFIWGGSVSIPSHIFNWSRTEIAVREPSQDLSDLRIAWLPT